MKMRGNTTVITRTEARLIQLLAARDGLSHVDDIHEYPNGTPLTKFVSMFADDNQMHPKDVVEWMETNEIY